MSFGLEVYTNNRQRSFSTLGVSDVPAKILFSRYMSGMGEKDSIVKYYSSGQGWFLDYYKVYYFDIGASVDRVSNVFITKSNNTFRGWYAPDNGNDNAFVKQYAELVPELSTGTTLAIRLVIYSGDWIKTGQYSFNPGTVDINFWVMGY